MDYESIFIEWWKQSYPFNPGAHAIMTHTAFAKYVLCLSDAQNAQSVKQDTTK
jgi:hypothetical protein